MKHTITSLVIISSALGLASCATQSTMGYNRDYVSTNTYAPAYSTNTPAYAGYNVGYNGGYYNNNYYNNGYYNAGYYYNGYRQNNRAYYSSSRDGNWQNRGYNTYRAGYSNSNYNNQVNSGRSYGGYHANGANYHQQSTSYYHNGSTGKTVNAVQQQQSGRVNVNQQYRRQSQGGNIRHNAGY